MLTKNGISAGPSRRRVPEHDPCDERRAADAVSPSRITDITSWPTISSHGRKRTHEHLPRLREYISSKNDSDRRADRETDVPQQHGAVLRTPGASDSTLFVRREVDRDERPHTIEHGG